MNFWVKRQIYPVFMFEFVLSDQSIHPTTTWVVKNSSDCGSPPQSTMVRGYLKPLDNNG